MHVQPVVDKRYLTEFEIGSAVTGRFGQFAARRWVVVPNVYWGWGLDYEADLIAVSPKSMTAYEIEIKSHLHDLKKDKSKRKFRCMPDPRIAGLWYAVPPELVPHALDPEIVAPEHGIIEVIRHENGIGATRVVRRPKKRRSARKVTQDELRKLLHLGTMRYWDLRFSTGNVSHRTLLPKPDPRPEEE